LSGAAPVAVLGTGQMGAAIASALLRAEHEVVVWNRTPAAAEPLVAAGSRLAASPAEAVAACATAFVVLSTYDASDSVLRGDGMADALAGRTVVQLTTGSPAQARAAAAWVEGCGGRALEGCPTAHAQRIGEPDAVTLYAGPQDLFAAERELLEGLGSARWLGEPLGLAKAATLSTGPLYHAAMVGFAHSAAFADAEGLAREDFRAAIEGFVPTLVALVENMARRVVDGSYDEPRTTIGKQVSTSALLLDAVRELGLRDELAELAAAEFARAAEAGRAGQDTAALFEIARRR